MKNNLVIVILVCLFLTACVPVESGSSPKITFIQEHGYTWEDQSINDMNYRIFFKVWRAGETGHAIHVVNLTKDQLEVELLKKQIRKIDEVKE